MFRLRGGYRQAAWSVSRTRPLSHSLQKMPYHTAVVAADWLALLLGITAGLLAWCALAILRKAIRLADRMADVGQGIMVAFQVNPHSSKYSDGADSRREEIGPYSAVPLPEQPQNVSGRHRLT
jgi:hypothetical protein